VRFTIHLDMKTNLVLVFNLCQVHYKLPHIKIKPMKMMPYMICI